MHSFEVHSNESACRKSGRLGLEQVSETLTDVANTLVDIEIPIPAYGTISKIMSTGPPQTHTHLIASLILISVWMTSSLWCRAG